MSATAAGPDPAPIATILTFLIADVRGYTRFTQEHGDEAAARLAGRFADLIEEVVTAHQGDVAELRGDEALCVFASARNALRCSLALQAAFTQAREADPDVPLKVGIGLDAGEAVPVKGGYRGGALNLAARLCAIAGPDEVLATRTVMALSGMVDGVRYDQRDPVSLKGIADPVEIVSIIPTTPRVRQKTDTPLQLPEGTAAFLYTDIEGSTRLWQAHPDAMPRVVPRHDALLRGAIERHQGVIFRNVGDGCCAAFVRTADAVRAAIEAQRDVQTEPWEKGISLRVRMAIHAGGAEVRAGEYVGHTLNRVARLLSAGHGGQTLLSRAAYELARDHLPAGVEVQDLGEHRLKDLAEPEHVFQLVVPGLPADFPPLASLPEQAAPVAVNLPTGAFLGSLPTGHLVGREAELARVMALADRVERGDGHLVLLAGEPGIGKTRLAQEVVATLRDREFILAAGRCYEPEQSVPYYPFLDALAMAHDAAPASLRRDAGHRWPYLGTLLPQKIDAPKIEASGGPEDQQNVFRAVTDFLEAVSAARPLGLLIDDLHWIDATSLRLLVHLAQHTRAHRILIVGTYRDVDIGPRHPLEGALRDLYRDGLMERIRLDRLDEVQAGELVASTLEREEVSHEFASLLHSRTEGNPYFIHQVLRVLIERGDVFRRDGIWDRRAIEEIEVPDSIRSVVEQRLHQLAEATWEVLREASVLGQTFVFDDVLALSELGEREVETAIDEASGAGLIRETGREAYGFDHALTQQSIYAELPSRKRRRLHLAAGTALEQLPERVRAGRAAEISRHFLEAGDLGRAARFAMLAGDGAEAVFAHSEAEQLYQSAAGFAEEIGEEALQAEALEKLGKVHELESRPDRALEALESAARIYRSEADLMGEARVTAGLSSALMHLGKPEDAITRLEAMLGALDAQGPSIELAKLSLQLSAILYGHGEFDASMERAERARDAARAVGDLPTVAGAELYRGDVFMQMGRMEDAQQIFEALIPDAEGAGDLGILAHNFNDVAVTYIYTGRFKEGVSAARRTVELQRQRESPSMVAFANVILGQAHFYWGQWADARRAFEEALQLIDGLPPSWHAPFIFGYLGMLDTVEGRWEDAREHLNRAIDIGTENRVVLPLAHQWLAHREMFEGDPASARERLAPFADDTSMWSLMMLPTLGCAQLESGDIPAAEALVTHVLNEMATQMHILVAEALRLRAMVYHRQGRVGEAGRTFEEAASLSRSMEYRFMEARVLHAEGNMRRDIGDHNGARDRWSAARALFQQLGARPDSERTEHELAQTAQP